MTTDEINRFTALMALHRTVGYGGMCDGLIRELLTLRDKAEDLMRRR